MPSRPKNATYHDDKGPDGFPTALAMSRLVEDAQRTRRISFALDVSRVIRYIT